MSDYKLGFFEYPYEVARCAGMVTGGTVTLLLSSPAIIIDWLYLLLSRCCQNPDISEEELYEICTYDIPEIFVNERIFAINDDDEVVQWPSKKRLYEGGEIIKYTNKLAEAVGTIVNIAVAGATFIAATLLQTAVIVAGVTGLLALGICCGLVLGTCLLGRICCVGPSQTFTDIVQSGFDKIANIL